MSGRGGKRSKLTLVAASLVLSCVVLPARAAADVIIHVSFTETHDRLYPDPHPGIVAHHDITATLDSKGQITESVQRSYGGHPGGEGHRHAGRVGHVGTNNQQLGDASGKVTWRVKGPHHLERIFRAPQSVHVTEIEVQDDKTCTATVRWLRLKGVADLVGRRDDNGELAHFTQPTLMSVDCEIR